MSVLLLLACAKPVPPVGPDLEPVVKPVVGPVITEETVDDLDGQTVEELECVAQPPEDVLLDTSDPALATVVNRRGQVSLSQVATFHDGRGPVETRVGGCAHYSATFSMDLEAAGGDPAAQLEAGLAALEALPLTADGQQWRARILETTRRGLGDAEAVSAGLFVDQEGYSHVYAGVTPLSPTRIRVDLTYDVAL